MKSLCTSFCLLLAMGLWGMGVGMAGAAPESLGTERFGAPALTVGSSIYVPGGYSDRGILGTIECFSATARETQRLSQPVFPRYFHTGAVHDEKIYLVGGLTPVPGGPCGVSILHTDVVEEFDPVAGTVTRLPSLPLAVARPGAAVVGDRLFVIGGALEDGTRTGAVQIYDFEKKEWTRGAEMSVAREGAVMESAGKIYAPGGFDGLVAIRDFQVYDPAKDRWERLPELPVKLSANHGLVVDGQLYTFGDYDILDRTAVYDFDQQKWALLDLGYKPSRHQGVARLGGDVFVVGGNVSSSAPFLSCIQRFSIKELAGAPRREWRSGTEKKPASPLAPGRGLEMFDLSGKPAPAIELPLFNGETFRLADQTGRVVVLDFWSTSCGPCVRALPEMAALANDFKGREVVFAGVCLDPVSRKDSVKSLLEKFEIPYAMGQGSSRMGKDYGVQAIPNVVVIGRDGKVQGRCIGFSSDVQAVLRQSIENLLDNRPAPMARNAAADASPARISRSGPMRMGIVSPPPDPRYFRLKWKQPLEDSTTRGVFGERVEWRLPPNLLVLRSGDNLDIRRAADGTQVRSIPLPSGAKEKEEWGGGPAFVYLRDGDSGVVAGMKTLYEVTPSESGGRSIRTIGMQWLGISNDGDLLWTREESQEQGGGVQLYALPADADHDLLLVPSWNRFQILDARGRTVVEQALGSSSDRWLFRPAPSGTGTEALVIGQSLACYEIVFPFSGSLDKRFFEKTWSRPAAAQEVLDLPPGRLHLQMPLRFLATKSAEQLNFIRADDGESVAEIPLTEEWRGTDGGGAFFVYLQNGKKGMAVALRTTTDSANETGVHLVLAALDEKGAELWKKELQEVSGEARIAALPAGKNHDLLLVELWNRLLFIDADGQVLLEQPLGVSTDPWLVRASQDGNSFTLIELGATLSGYQWKPSR